MITHHSGSHMRALAAAVWLRQRQQEAAAQAARVGIILKLSMEIRQIPRGKEALCHPDELLDLDNKLDIDCSQLFPPH